ncbi:unnamed protein product, partial [Cyprideis torosa]
MARYLIACCVALISTHDNPTVNGGSLFNIFQLSKDTIPDPCYDYETGMKPQRCVPDFVNAAFGKEVIASSTCGEPPNKYCFTERPEENAAAEIRKCEVCDANSASLSHPSRYITDLNNPSNLTCWQSENLLPETTDNVTLVVHLGKKYELTYISLQFCGQKPDSMVIYKSMDYGQTWHPFQYYSSQCRKMFGRQVREQVTKANEHEAICTDSHTGDQILTNRIAFSTLDGRPSAGDLDRAPVLQDWVTATDIKVVFKRLSPPATYTWDTPKLSSSVFNDTVTTTAKALTAPQDTYYYSLADLDIGGRCKCNGHASKCSAQDNGELACECKHNTAGRDCEKCKPFHFDRPWSRATATEGNECVGKCSFEIENVLRVCGKSFLP